MVSGPALCRPGIPAMHADHLPLSLLHESPDPFVVLRGNRLVEALNPALERAVPGAVAGADFLGLVEPSQREAVLPVLVQAAAGRAQRVVLTHAGTLAARAARVEWSLFPGEGGRVVGLGRTVVEGGEARLELEQARAQLSTQQQLLDRIQRDLVQVPFVDPLTGVWNRMQVLDRLAGEWSRTERHGGALACLLVDVETAADLRAGGEQDMADRLLREVAQHLKGLLRGHDILGRYGGDRLVVVASPGDAASAQALGQRLCACVAREPLRPGGHEQPVRLRVGAATSQSEGVDILEDLLTQGEAALASAREGRRDVLVAP